MIVPSCHVINFAVVCSVAPSSTRFYRSSNFHSSNVYTPLAVVIGTSLFHAKSIPDQHRWRTTCFTSRSALALIQVSYYAANIGGMLLGQVVQWPCLYRSPWVLLSHAVGLPRHLRTRRSMMYQMPTPPEIDDLSSAPAYFVTSDSDPRRTTWHHDPDPKNLRTRGTCHYSKNTHNSDTSQLTPTLLGLPMSVFGQ